MAFKKIGDAQPVGGYYDVNSPEQPVICKKCGQQKTIVAMSDDKNELVCECDIAEESDGQS